MCQPLHPALARRRDQGHNRGNVVEPRPHRSSHHSPSHPPACALQGTDELPAHPSWIGSTGTPRLVQSPARPHAASGRSCCSRGGRRGLGRAPRRSSGDFTDFGLTLNIRSGTTMTWPPRRLICALADSASTSRSGSVCDQDSSSCRETRMEPCPRLVRLLLCRSSPEHNVRVKPSRGFSPKQARSTPPTLRTAVSIFARSWSCKPLVPAMVREPRCNARQPSYSCAVELLVSSSSTFAKGRPRLEPKRGRDDCSDFVDSIEPSSSC